LFSAVASAFIIEVNSQLQPDPNDETAALLRVLIHKIDNTTFGNDPPALPQWTSPSPTIVQVQAVLVASLFVSIFSAFLAMLGKQWLNRYASTDMRGTAIERSQNRQRKLDGVNTWYFNHVIELLPLMLQVGPLLLGCALSQYLWGVNITVASVVAGLTSAGVIFYLVVVVAGTTSESCPYQTLAARILRHVLLPALYSLTSKPLALIQVTFSYRTLGDWWSDLDRPWYSASNTVPLLSGPVILSVGLVADFYRLGRGVAQLLVASGRMVYGWFTGIPRHQRYTLDQQVIVPDLRCVSWMLQTSLDSVVRLSTLEHLATMTTLSGFDPIIIEDCFNAFVGCISVSDDKVVVVQGLEQLAAVSALCFVNTIFHLLVVDPTSGALEDVHQHYSKVFPARSHFHVHQFCHTLNMIHDFFTHPRVHRSVCQSFQWNHYGSFTHEHTIVAHNLVKFALLGYQRPQRAKVPRWILRFAFQALSVEPSPPTSVIADCLSIVAIDLRCDLSDARTTMSDERWVYI